MPNSKRDPLRCINPECRSVRHGGPNGGRVLLERARGVVYKETGGDLLAVLGMWLYAECGTCHARRYNPDMVAFDGMGAAIERTIERTMQAVAERVNEDIAADHPPVDDVPRRRRLRGAA